VIWTKKERSQFANPDLGKTLENAQILPNVGWTKMINSLNISLSASPSVSEIKANQTVMLLFRFLDSETNKPIKQIERLLGSSGHCVILSSKAEQFVHAHAAEAMSGGAKVMFHTVFPEDRIYNLWVLFQFKGWMITVSFVVNVR
jgi:hypothetical protein